MVLISWYTHTLPWFHGMYTYICTYWLHFLFIALYIFPWFYVFMLNEWVFNDISMTCESFLALSWNDLIFINVEYLIFILIYRIVYHRFYEDSNRCRIARLEGRAFVKTKRACGGKLFLFHLYVWIIKRSRICLKSLKKIMCLGTNWS